MGDWREDPVAYRRWYVARWKREPPQLPKGVRTVHAREDERIRKNAAKLVAGFCAALLPPIALDINEWAERYRVMSRATTALPGPWRSMPYQVEPMECMSPSHPCDRVVTMCASQTIKSETALNTLGYAIHIDPGPMLYVVDVKDRAGEFSEERIDPMINDCPVLKQLVVSKKGSQAGNTKSHKRLHTGVSLNVVGANAPGDLAFRSVRWLFMDEIDRWTLSAGKEGDPVKIAEARTTKFWNRKIFMASSPTLESLSRIAKAFKYSDQRQFLVPCPHCKYKQALLFSQLTWDRGKGSKSTFYICAQCKKRIDEHHKHQMIERGSWVATNPDGKYPGFWISQLYILEKTWAQIVEEWIECGDDPLLKQAFVNTVLGEVYRDTGQKPDWERLKGRTTVHRMREVPMGVLFLTAGVDVQKDRLEMYVWGFGRRRQRWLIDKVVIPGDPYNLDTWQQLTEAVLAGYEHESGIEMDIRRVAVDTGYAGTAAYDWARLMGHELVICIKGYDGLPALLGSPKAAEYSAGGRKLPAGVLVRPLDVSACKSEFYANLNMETPQPNAEGMTFYPSGWVFLPPLSDDEYRQLTAEEYQLRIRRGIRRGEWVVTNPGGRNEALDCANYARAAAESFGWSRMGDRQFKVLEGALGLKDMGTEEIEVAPQPPDQREKMREMLAAKKKGRRRKWDIQPPVEW